MLMLMGGWAVESMETTGRGPRVCSSSSKVSVVVWGNGAANWNTSANSASPTRAQTIPAVAQGKARILFRVSSIGVSPV